MFSKNVQSPRQSDECICPDEDSILYFECLMRSVQDGTFAWLAHSVISLSSYASIYVSPGCSIWNLHLTTHLWWSVISRKRTFFFFQQLLHKAAKRVKVLNVLYSNSKCEKYLLLEKNKGQLKDYFVVVVVVVGIMHDAKGFKLILIQRNCPTFQFSRTNI